MRAILRSIANLNYPKHKLDVKIILEDDDKLTIKKITKIKLPSYIDIIKVPYSMPRTKPKAMNYAMNYVLGKYCVIYDAEDVPDKNQLLDAIIAFNSLPEEYACIQSRLNFYNANENLLTKLFSIEYSMWFGVLLTYFANLALPIPLGGTSNHFKTDVIRRLGLG